MIQHVQAQQAELTGVHQEGLHPAVHLCLFVSSPESSCLQDRLPVLVLSLCQETEKAAERERQESEFLRLLARPLKHKNPLPI